METRIFKEGTIVSTRQNPTWTWTSHGNKHIIVWARCIRLHMYWYICKNYNSYLLGFKLYSHSRSLMLKIGMHRLMFKFYFEIFSKTFMVSILLFKVYKSDSVANKSVCAVILNGNNICTKKFHILVIRIATN